MRKKKILLIQGAGRSGTTVLDRYLSQQFGWISGGELNYFWDAGFFRNQKCSCNTPLQECKFWSKVVKATLTELNLPLEKIVKIQQNVDRRKFLPLLLFPKLQNKEFKENVKTYCLITRVFYKNIFKIANKKVLVDSSKDPAHALLLKAFFRKDEDIEIYILHIIRDSRAVAYSRLKKKRKLSIEDREEYMPIIPSYITSIKWLVLNLLVERLFRQYNNYKRIRYEDFCKNVDYFLKQIEEFIHEKRLGLPKESTLHTSLGNPSKHKQQGFITLNLDEEWKEKIKLKDKIITTLLTYPLLKKYKYL